MDRTEPKWWWSRRRFQEWRCDDILVMINKLAELIGRLQENQLLIVDTLAQIIDNANQHEKD